MQFNCPHCSEELQVRLDSKGRRVCRRCGAVLPQTVGQPPAVPQTLQGTGVAAGHQTPGSSGVGRAILNQPVLGSYVILGELGRGGMGRVYKGVHQTLRQIRALKVLAKSESRDPRVVARFRREARIVAGLDHPNIVKVFEFEQDTERGLYYIVME